MNIKALKQALFYFKKQHGGRHYVRQNAVQTKAQKQARSSRKLKRAKLYDRQKRFLI